MATWQYDEWGKGYKHTFGDFLAEIEGSIGSSTPTSRRSLASSARSISSTQGRGRAAAVGHLGGAPAAPVTNAEALSAAIDGLVVRGRLMVVGLDANALGPLQVLRNIGILSRKGERML